MNDLASAIRVQINGEVRPLPVGQPLVDVIVGLGLPPQGVLVEHNGLALLRSEWDGRQLSEGDQLEIFRVVAGG